MSSLYPLMRVDENTASTCGRVMPLMGLSLCTYTASASIATRITVGMLPYFFSKASISLTFMARLMGPRFVVSSVSVGGAVLEPAAWIWILTLGYSRLNSSAHWVMRFASVSEPTLERLPDTPLAFLYSGIFASRPAACAPSVTVSRLAAASSFNECIIFLSLGDRGGCSSDGALCRAILC